MLGKDIFYENHKITSKIPFQNWSQKFFFSLCLNYNPVLTGCVSGTGQLFGHGHLKYLLINLMSALNTLGKNDRSISFKGHRHFEVVYVTIGNSVFCLTYI